jgi:putative FmdB family regulatory protein
MPFYEYKCIECELLQRITDDTIPSCPECSGKSKKLICKTEAKVVLDARSLGEKLKAEAKKDAQAIREGDWEKAADYLGEDGAEDFYKK